MVIVPQYSANISKLNKLKDYGYINIDDEDEDSVIKENYWINCNGDDVAGYEIQISNNGQVSYYVYSAFSDVTISQVEEDVKKELKFLEKIGVLEKTIRRKK